MRTEIKLAGSILCLLTVLGVGPCKHKPKNTVCTPPAGSDPTRVARLSGTVQAWGNCYLTVDSLTNEPGKKKTTRVTRQLFMDFANVDTRPALGQVVEVSYDPQTNQVWYATFQAWPFGPPSPTPIPSPTAAPSVFPTPTPIPSPTPTPSPPFQVSVHTAFSDVAPIGGAQVSVVGSLKRQAYQCTTDATGICLVSVISPGSYQFTATKVGHVFATLTIPVTANRYAWIYGQTTPTPTPQPTPTPSPVQDISGQVTADGSLYTKADATVTVMTTSFVPVVSQTVGPDGRFHFNQVVVGHLLTTGAPALNFNTIKTVGGQTEYTVAGYTGIPPSPTPTPQPTATPTPTPQPSPTVGPPTPTPTPTPTPSTTASGATLYYQGGAGFAFVLMQLLNCDRAVVSELQEQGNTFAFPVSDGCWIVRPKLEVWNGYYAAAPTEIKFQVCNGQSVSGLDFTLGEAAAFPGGGPVTRPDCAPQPTPTPTPTPSPPGCVFTVPGAITLAPNSSVTISVLLQEMTAPVTITTETSSTQISIAPVRRTVAGTSALVNFLISKRQAGGSIIFQSECGQKTLVVQ